MAAQRAGALAHRGLAWACLLLAFVGWVLILSSVASLQQACSGGMVTTLSDLARLTQAAGRRLLQDPVAGFPGAVGYLAPVQCHKFFSFVWWIWAFDSCVLILLAVGVTTLISTLRGTLIAITAVLLVLLMDTANTFLYFNHIDGLTSTVAARARVLVAGSIISSIAYFLLIGVIGWNDEDATVEEEHFDAEAAGMTRKRKGAGAGGLLGMLGVKKKEMARTEEEPVGTGAPGSPRMIQVPRAPVVAQPVGGGGAGATLGSPAGGTFGAITPGRLPATTTTTVTSATAVPVSTQAGTIGAAAI